MASGAMHLRRAGSLERPDPATQAEEEHRQLAARPPIACQRCHEFVSVIPGARSVTSASSRGKQAMGRTTETSEDHSARRRRTVVSKSLATRSRSRPSTSSSARSGL